MAAQGSENESERAEEEEEEEEKEEEEEEEGERRRGRIGKKRKFSQGDFTLCVLKTNSHCSSGQSHAVHAIIIFNYTFCFYPSSIIG